MVVVQEADGVADGHLVATEARLGRFPDADIHAIDVDRGIGKRPELARIGLPNQDFLGAKLQDLPGAQPIGAGIEILDVLADVQLRADCHCPFWIGKDAVNGRPQAVEFEARRLVQCLEQL
jgi:hypothetical protein